MDDIKPDSQLLLYQSPYGQINIDVHLVDETVWLTQVHMAKLFGKGRSTIAEHIQNVFNEGELDGKLVCRNFRHTTQHGAITGKTRGQAPTLTNIDGVKNSGSGSNRVRASLLTGLKIRQIYKMWPFV